MMRFMDYLNRVWLGIICAVATAVIMLGANFLGELVHHLF